MQKLLNEGAVITYKDVRNCPTELTNDELNWFQRKVTKARQATGYEVPIIPYDHDLYAEKGKNALGRCFTTDPTNALDENAGTYITIDCYFIHECYQCEVCGDYLIAVDTLDEVLAHEIAHLLVWRHGKKHRELSAYLLEKIQSV